MFTLQEQAQQVGPPYLGKQIKLIHWDGTSQAWEESKLYDSYELYSCTCLSHIRVSEGDAL